MEKKRKIVQYRERLDKTLASTDLINEERLKTLVKNQILRSSEPKLKGNEDKIIETKTTEVSKFLDMLRSASVDDSGRSKTSHADWKLKQDNEEFRVMYREGPEGTPFHTLLVEGYVDGPVDVCLCISWEAFLYKKWWPQITVPTFKIISSECLQKVQIGEQISLVRVKVSWPLSSREAVLHYYLFEYFEEDLIVVVMNKVPESKSIDGTLHGFDNEAIPEAKDVVRIDLVGGFALQKVTSERSYFRTIANMDIKLDFVPPSLINFISRQLIGSGFRLYQKAVASNSMMSQDEEFSKALADPLYARIREALYDIRGSKRDMDEEEVKQGVNVLPSKDLVGNKHEAAKYASQKDKENQHVNEFTPLNEVVQDSSNAFDEIEEVDSEEIVRSKEEVKKVNDIPIAEVDTRSLLKGKRKVYTSSEVQQALETLDKAISFVREHGFHSPRFSSTIINTNEELLCTEKGDVGDSYSPKQGQMHSMGEDREVSIEGTSQEACGSKSGINNLRQTKTNPSLKEVNINKVVPASPEQFLTRHSEVSQVALSSLEPETPFSDQTTHSNKQLNSLGIQEVSSDKPKKSNRRKKNQCCFVPAAMLKGKVKRGLF